MSFSYEIKDEILQINQKNKCCLKAELTAILKYFVKIQYDKQKNEVTLILQSKNQKILQNFKEIINTLFIKYNTFDNFNINKTNKNYILKLKNHSLIESMFSFVGICIESKFENTDFIFDSLPKTCCKRTYLRLVFIFCGYICNPERKYHIEFVNYDYSQTLELKNIMLYFNITPKIIKRKDYFILYIKEGEQIVDLLNIISAHKALLKLENIRILKDVRNNINRQVNCETANLNKIITASFKQKQDIILIKKTLGLESLSPQLREIAKLRLKFPDLSLKELSQKLNPPISKSGANHRFSKIHSIANRLRGDNNVEKNN